MPRTSNLPIRDAAPIFAALGDDVHLSLVARLARGESLSITRLSAGLPMTRQAVTKHLRVLEDAGLISGARQGREQLWELKPDALREAQQYLETISRQWGDALGRLKTFVEEK
ncbi:MAG: ArsR/SmtB family transcription factor [Terriglobales bacterium]